jgi:conjugative transposon TraN protein
MYYQFKIENNSAISYDIDQLRFFIRDQKKSKRTASQQIEVSALYVHGQNTRVEGQSEQVLVFALPKFTIPDNKLLQVQLMEKGGGRHLALSTKNRVIMNAQLVP